MAASSAAIAALEAHLLRADYQKALCSLKDVQTFVLQCYPRLEVKMVKISDGEGDGEWVVVYCEKYSRVKGSPVRPARLIFDEDGTYRFEVLQRWIMEGVFATSQRNLQFILRYVPRKLRLCSLSWDCEFPS